MPEDRTADAQLANDLAEYFAITTAAAMPRAVSEMSAATLRAKRRPVSALFVPAGALLTGTAVVAVSLALSHGTSSPPSSASRAGGAGAPFLSIASPKEVGGAGPAVDYPGVDGRLLESAGHTRLRSAAGHGAPAITPARARAAAIAVEGPQPGIAGPAVLAWVEDLSRSPVRCLCWVVDVPVSGSMAPGVGSHTVLVYVDATTGRYAGTHTGDGVP